MIWRLSRTGIIFSGSPSFIMLVLFYSLAVHMHRSLGEWPASIGERGFPAALIFAWKGRHVFLHRVDMVWHVYSSSSHFVMPVRVRVKASHPLPRVGCIVFWGLLEPDAFGTRSIPHMVVGLEADQTW
jgi:hypothetical protein